MNKLFLSYILFCLHTIFIYTEPKYSADISFLVADLKYNKKDGIKICEVQHGALSAVDGDLYIAGGDGTISPAIAHFFNAFPAQKWATGHIYPPLKRSFIATEWKIEDSLKAVVKNPTFLEYATQSPIDPFSIRSYQGMVYADYNIAQNYDFYYKAYPGILFINAATFPYWKDKYKMNALFDHNDELKQYKADWRLYPKKYSAHVAENIQHDMPSEFYVIKPRKEFLANGVIVVASKDLDNTLQMILEPQANLEKHPDKKYTYWSKNRDDTFLIEKFYESDYICNSLLVDETTPSGTEYHYDATMRIAFILQYNQGIMSYHFLGGFWKLPYKALEENGTLNETKISYCKPPCYQAVDQKLLQEVNAEMEKAMLFLYEIMINEQKI